MTSFAIKGWCPGALRPMRSGDGLVTRIRPPLGRLTPAQTLGIARAAETHGNGLIDLSARANLQLRGIRPEAHLALLDDLSALGLIDPDVETESRRNLLITPFWTEGDGTISLAAALIGALANAPVLPQKFGFAIDTGPAPVLTEASADIRLERRADGALILRPDGAAKGLPTTAERFAEDALALARWFLATGGAPEGRGRMARHLATGIALPDGYAEPAQPGTGAPDPGPHPLGALIGPAFGQFTADTLARLAPHPIRPTPWRMILAEGAASLPDDPALVTRPTDPRRRVTTCTGAPACPQALRPTRVLAAALAPLVPEGDHLHLSGCAKGCAHPGPAALTLTGTAEGFALIRNGTAADNPIATLAPADLIQTLFKAP